jgi:phosphopantothenoylcysteine decarboxylase / phosphopantothenate---cysteine ligase
MKKIVIGITGSIAAYKTCELISRLKKKNYNIEVIMTKNAAQFVTPLTFGALIHKPVLIDDFDETGYQIKHINIVKDADCFIIVPATANIIAKVAHGLADDVLSSAFLAATCPKIIAPAMNVHMYENTATQKNLDICKSYHIKIVEPEIGELACGYQGRGHLSDIEDLLDAIEYATSPHPLAGKHVLITAGPTQEPLDPVRFISNHSSGKMGYALAKVARQLGAHVTLISGPSSQRAPYEVDVIKIQSAQGMFKQVLSYFDFQDYVIMSAAVGDYRPLEYSNQKIKKKADEFYLKLGKNEDILSYIGKHKTKQTICGFAMETENVIENAQNKFFKKNCDLLVVNDLFEDGAGFKTDTNKVALITKNFVDYLDLMSKEDLAHIILEKLMGNDHVVAFVGDGINDAPVLARSDIGIAMGGVGSDVAIEAADVVLMSDDITSIAKAIQVSHYTNFILKENVTFTLLIKIGVLVLTLFGLTNMWMGVFADVGVTLIAICNSMRILYKKS